MDFNDSTKFKKLTTFSGFSKDGGISHKALVHYEASEGYYVSSEGDVWNTNRRKPKKLSSSGGGYLECKIKLKNGSFKLIFLHRLVATCWCEGFNLEEGKIIVNHIDENKQNNHPSNLEWCTNKYNVNHGTGIERKSSALKRTCNTPEYKEKMSQIWKNAELREKMVQAVKETCNKQEFKAKMSQVKKDQWKAPGFKEKMRKRVALFHTDGTPYKVFSSAGEASAYAGVSPSTMSDRLKVKKPSKCGRYYWDYYKTEV